MPLERAGRTGRSNPRGPWGKEKGRPRSPTTGRPYEVLRGADVRRPSNGRAPL